MPAAAGLLALTHSWASAGVAARATDDTAAMPANPSRDVSFMRVSLLAELGSGLAATHPSSVDLPLGQHNRPE